jgi:hypothetical protein
MSLVDSFFLLRLVLEYYRVERIERLRVVKQVFNKVAAEPGNLSFREFMAVFNYMLCNLSTLERLQLYRECYYQGSGKISA